MLTQSPQQTTWKVLIAAVVLAISLVSSAFASEEPKLSAPLLMPESLPAANGNSTCVNIQQGTLGDVADAYICAAEPDVNDGSSNVLYTGLTNNGETRSLIRFDLGVIPPGAIIDSATFYLNLTTASHQLVRVHEITAPWSEAQVTWNNFGDSFAPVTSASFLADSAGLHQTDVTELVRAWINGTPNYGMLLEENLDGFSIFSSSDNSNVQSRPRLEVCYHYPIRAGVSKSVAPSVAQPGDLATFALTLNNTGATTVTNVIVTDTIPTDMTVLSVASTLAITDTGYTPAYVWTVQDLAPGQRGVITITGRVTTTITSNKVITNQADMTFMSGGQTFYATSQALLTINVPPAYMLTVNYAGNGSGSVTTNPSGSTFAPGTLVTLTANANPGSSFVGWSGDVTGTANPTTLTMNSNKTVTATFTLNTYLLTINTAGNGSGSVTTNPAGPTFTYGTVVTLTANANPGSSFAGWSGDATGTANPTTLTMNSNKTVTATFTTLNIYTLAVNYAGNGSGSVTTNPSGPKIGRAHV